MPLTSAQLGTYSYTSRLLNYVEPYYIDGIAKTSFYTEVNTNTLQDDKVFITNGYYDSETLYISRGKYVQNADGYNVLYTNNCQIVIDIPYNGSTQSYNDDDFDNYLKIYHITSQREFDYINKLYIDSYTFSRVSKFESGYTNNIIYADDVYLDNSNNTSIGYNSGITSPGQFWARSGFTWSNVTNQFNLNLFTFSTNYHSSGLTNNGRLYIIGEDFTYDNSIYKQRGIYNFGGTAINSWKIDIQYKIPIISKLYFKQGIFRGTHNDGIFGSYIGSEQNWYGTQSTWNSGFFINSNWNSGLMGSKSTNTNPSYYATLNNGVPMQTTDFSNNRGNGYNYVLDSNFYNGEIVNGNFINCNIGPTSSGLTAIDGYFGTNNNFTVLSLGGLYNYCDIINSEITNSTTLDSIIINSYLKDTNTLNSQISESYSNGGEISINNGINIISSDMVSYIPSSIGIGITYSQIRGVLKLYISDDDYNRLDIFDNFFITQINKNYILSSLSTDQSILLPYETRYVLDTFFDFKINGINQECLVSIKGKSENIFKVEVNYDDISKTYVNNIFNNNNIYSSIDIDLSQYVAFYKNISDGTYTYINQNIVTKSSIQNLFLNTSISNSDFRNGVADQVTWYSGSNVNYPSNIIQVANNELQISKYSSTELQIYLNETQPTINDNQLSIGTYVWLDSIYYTSNSGSIINLSSVYKITNVTQDNINPVIIRLSNPTIVGSLGATGGTYSVPGSLPLYVSINKLLVDNSEIKSGLFIRTLFTNTLFSNSDFNNLDVNITNSNTELLRMVNLLFENNNNTIENGTVHKSHILNVNWVSGILNNSIWIGATFGGGVFNNGYWLDGTFNNGYFQKSKGISLNTIDYSSDDQYNCWLNGVFNNGYFYNSVWLNGVFNNGKLYNSDWYSGIWNYGLLGDKNIPTLNTTMGMFPATSSGGTQTIWNDGIVDNAQIGGNGIVSWYGGNFNGGIFSSNGNIVNNNSIWYNGNFNGGNFTKLAKWKNGTFSKGKFTSYYGWTMSSSTQSIDYSWENGTFVGGQFGNSSYGTNSTWFYGEFNGGIFQGRVWNDGVFQNGNFNGGGTYTAISNKTKYTLSFTQSYYGLWRNGWVVDVKHKAITNQLIPTNNLRSNQLQQQNIALLQNILWVNGNFNHQSGIIENSVWLSGTFSNGIFTKGSFNPYVNRTWWNLSSGTYSSFDLTENCSWINGTFDGSFYISDWNDGTFINGVMAGARWIEGTWKCGKAKNIYWENGIWENGIWEGDPFDYTNLTGTSSIINNDMIYSSDRDMILRVSNILRDGKIHILNAFSGTYSSQLLIDPSLNFGFVGWTYSTTLLAPWTSVIGGGLSPVNLIFTPGPTITSNLSISSGNNYTYLISIGTNISPGDIFNITVINASISYTAVAGDSKSSVTSNLISLINLGISENIVQYQQINQYGNIVTKYSTWGYVNGLTSISSVFSSGFISLSVTSIYFPYVYTNAFRSQLTTTYAKSEVLNAISTGATTSIFTDVTNYNINLTVSSSSGRTDFFVYIGDNLYSETITNATITYNYSYTPLSNFSSSKLGIQRVLYPNPDSSIFTLLSASIIEVVPVYNGQYNNNLYKFATFSSPFNYGITGASVSLPKVLTPYITSSNKIVSLKFGNGVFKSGIWMGGFWNSGWRSTWDGSTDIVVFSNVSSVIKVSPNLWNITLDIFDSSNLSLLKVGDNVSIGNLVYIDINERRNLVKDYYRIINITQISITVEIFSNLPIRRIVQDSCNHMIYVTKNIWMSGIFYNGYFKGVWNYGYFNGYPYITKMGGSIWIDGIFDGGRFSSTQSIYIESGVTYSYNTGLVQNFTFRDNNISQPFGFIYDSWIDVNYLTYSMVNIFKNNLTYNSNYDVSISDGNLKGYPTVDILSSNSIFKNSFDANFQYYKLGYSYIKYIDYIGNGSLFNYPITMTGNPGPSQFISNGWTYSNFSTQYYSNTNNSEVLNVNYIGGKGDILDNIYTQHIERYRYSTIEFELDYFTGSAYQSSTSSLPSIFLLNDFSNASTPGNFNTVINHAETGIPGTKIEYFYNRSSLELLFISTDGFTASFGNIEFFETDMVPFFRYTTENNVDQSIKIPIYGTVSCGAKFDSLGFNGGYPQAISNPQAVLAPTTTSTTTTTTTLYGGIFTLEADYELDIIGVTGTSLPGFALPLSTFNTTTSLFSITIPSQTIDVTLNPDTSWTTPPQPQRYLSMLVDGVEVYIVSITYPFTTQALILSNPVPPTSNISIVIVTQP